MTRRSTSYQLATAAMPVDETIPHIPSAAERYATATAKPRQNKPRKELSAMTETVPLIVLGLEIGIDAAALAQRFGDAVVIDQAGCRAIGVATAKAFIDATNAARQRERERQAQLRAEAAARPNLLRERARRLKARPTPADPTISAYAAMIGGTSDDHLARAGHHMDEMLSGKTSMCYHKITQED